jgi:polyisoprenoid-binding protein YceI
MEAAAANVPVQRFEADPVHSSVGFRVAHMDVATFEGSFGQVRASLAGAGGRLALEGAARVESISIADPPEFRAHLLGEEFFDAERHPELRFRSHEVEVGGDAAATVHGELTIRGITRPLLANGRLTGPVDDPFGGRRAALELEATVDRRDFGMDWNMPLPNGGDALGTEVTLAVHLEFVQTG